MAQTSDEFTSCTSEVAFYSIPLTETRVPHRQDFPNRNLVLVDTPGFDDTNVSDALILKRIALALAFMSVSGALRSLPQHQGADD